MNLIFLSRWLPYPAINGSKLRIYNLLKQLAVQGHQIHLISFYNDGEDYQAAAEHLTQFCATTEFVLYKPFQTNSLKARLAFLAPWPRSVIATYQPEMTARLLKRVQAPKEGPSQSSSSTGKKSAVDLIIASEIDMAYYGLKARKYGVGMLVEDLEVGVIYGENQRAKTGATGLSLRSGLKRRLRTGLTWFKLANYVRYLAWSSRAITVVSEQEKALVQPLCGRTPCYIIPNGTDLEYNSFVPYEAEKRLPQLIFQGALTFRPNYQAMHFFLTEIAPLLKTRWQNLTDDTSEARPGLKLLITGNNRGVDLTALKPSNPAGSPSSPIEVVLTGLVPDLRPLVTESFVSISPLLEGGGTRLKILEAFALGTPVVATAKAAEGLSAQPGEHFLQADTAEEFAEAVLRLYTDPALAGRLTRQARQLVEDRFDWRVIGQNLSEVIKKLV